MPTTLESLEARRLLALVTWDGGGDNTSWTDPANWVGDLVPVATDDVLIDTAGPTINIPSDAVTTLSLHSLTVLHREATSTQSFSSPPLALHLESELRIGSGGALSILAPGRLSLTGNGTIHVESGGTLVANRLLQFSGFLSSTMPIVNRGLVSVSGSCTFLGGITNYGKLQLVRESTLEGAIVNESSGLITVERFVWSPGSEGSPMFEIGLGRTASGALTTAPFVNRGRVEVEYPASSTLLPYTNPASNVGIGQLPGLTVYVDSSPTIGGTWGTGIGAQQPFGSKLRFTRFNSGSQNIPVTLDETFRFEAGTLVLNNLDVTVRGMAPTTGLYLTSNTRAVFADARTELALLGTRHAAGFGLAPGNRTLVVQDFDVRGTGPIDIGEGLLIHGNRPGFMQQSPPNTTPATTPTYAASIAGTFNGSPITLEPNGNSHAVGYSRGDGLAVHYPTHTFNGETFDDNDFIFFTTLRGDANFDRQVDFADVLTLSQHYGQATSRGYADGNFEGNVADSGTIGFEDLLRLAQNYGAPFERDGVSSSSSAKRSRAREVLS